MYTVIDKEGLLRGRSPDLNIAIEMAKYVDEFVTIQGPDFEVCGVFGVDEVRDPDYDGWISRKKR
jgi:hypothetical protein